jgi:hypothetical protein
MIITGFKTGLDIDNAETLAQCVSGDLTMRGLLIYGNVTEDLASDDTLQQQCAALPGFDLRFEDAQLADAFNREAPDFRPAAGSPATENVVAVPAGDDFLTEVDFIGAVGPGAEEWYQGWTTWAQN